MTAIITKSASFSPPPLLHFPEALEAASSNKVVLYCRVSDWTQSTSGSLEKQFRDVWEATREFDCRLKAIHRGVELGKLSGRRHKLQGAFHAARRHRAILLANDLSRFIRSESYDAKENRWAFPTEEEIEKLRRRARGVAVLATLIHPDTPPQELLSRAVKRGLEQSPNMGGRPRSIDYRMEVSIWKDYCDGYSESELATKYDKTKSSIHRFLVRMKAIRKP